MKIGIIGPEKSVNMVLSVIGEYFPGIEYRVFLSEKVESVGEVIEAAINKTDGLLFTGCALLGEAEKKFRISKPHEAITRNDSSLIKAFWEIREDNRPMERISVDIVDEDLVHMVSEEFGLPVKEVYSMPYDPERTEKEYIDRHLELWNEGKVDVILSALRLAYDEFLEKGLPVYRLNMTTPLIILALKNLIGKIRTSEITANQIAILLIQIKNMKSNVTAQYDNLIKRNRVEKELINYLREVQGSMFQVGPDKYMIFGTRRTLADEESMDGYINTMMDFDMDKIVIHTGLGFGHTGWNAEYNATTALELAQKSSTAAFFIVDENSNVRGPIRDSQEQSYVLQVSDRRMNELAQRIGISSTYLSKILSIMAKHQVSTFSSDTMGQYLGVTERSARRILDKFLDADCARVVTNSVAKGVGRPKKIVEIDFDLAESGSEN